MTNPLSFDELQAILRQRIEPLPAHRKPSPNTRYTIQDAVWSAFGIFFTQSPSFWEYQRRLQHTKGHNNAQTLLGVAQIPCDNQVRTLLDPLAPSSRDPVCIEVFKRLEQHRMLDTLRVLGDQRLVALDGTNEVASQTIYCHNCLTRQLSNGHTLSYHPAITPVIVCPGRSAVTPLPPEDIMPQDGHDKQDCEQAASTRRLTTHAQAVAPSQVILLGDDLSSKQSFCPFARQQGFPFLLVCKPYAHAMLSERLAFLQANDGLAELERRRWHGRFTAVLLYRYSVDP
jgi:hypothetical protein